MSTYQLNKAVYELSRRPDRRAAIQDKDGLFAAYDLGADERAALAEPNFSALRALGLLPNLLFRYYLLHGLSAARFRQRLLDEAGRTAETGER